MLNHMRVLVYRLKTQYGQLLKGLVYKFCAYILTVLFMF